MIPYNYLEGNAFGPCITSFLWYNKITTLLIAENALWQRADCATRDLAGRCAAAARKAGPGNVHLPQEAG
jgi:hypothetical protein